MSRNLLWSQLKKINPNTKQQWPKVSINSLRHEINQIIKKEIIKKINKQIRFVEKSEKKQLKKDKYKQKGIIKFLDNPVENNKITLSASQFINFLKYINFNNDYVIEMKYDVDGISNYKVIVNYTEIKELLKYIKEGIFTQDVAIGHGSDVEIIEQIIIFGKNVTLTWFNKKNYNKTYNGAYFKYYNKTNVDLSRYQIYNKTQEINYEPCLYYAFEQAGVHKLVLDQLKFMIQEKDILLRELNKIAKAIDYKIIIKYNDSRNKACNIIYNKESERIINLGLIDEHYFLNEEVNYNFSIFTGKRADTRNNKKTSYDIIRYLYVNKEEYLTPITIENINNHEHFLEFDKNYELRDLLKGEYKTYNTTIEEKSIFNGKFKTNNPNDNYKICFLDLETYSDNHHKSYCLGYSYSDENELKHFYGLNCVEQFLESLKTNTIIITHNLAFDFRGFINNLLKFQTPIETGTKLKVIQCKYKNKITKTEYHLLFKDNCAFLPFKLSVLPKMFNLESGEKDIYPYTLINQNNINSLIELDEVLNHIKEDEHFDFIVNCNKANCIEGTKVDIKKYTIYYCNQDVNILKQAYLTFRNQILEITKLDILSLVSLPQLADEYFKLQGVYEGCYKICGVSQDFIRRACHGGRVMVSDNKKVHVKNKKISDFDAVSLYPSAMYRLNGYLKGIPKLITSSIDWFNQDYYYVEIEITGIKIKRSFPLISIKDEKTGIKNYTNDVIGKVIVVDKITLEDLINFQGIEYKFIRGYYFNNGFNPKIKEVIEFMFNERIKLKKQNNPLQNAYKLILNASYGKLIQKPIKKTKKFYEGNYRNYVIRNAKNIIDYQRINDNLICVNQKKSIIQHYTGCHMASQVLSMSKRIMNEVMTLAEDLNLKIYYQDTDSMHIEQQHIKILSENYKLIYNRDLIGSKMGQFHSDFEVKGADKDFEITAVESIFLGKKAYIDKLEYKLNGEIKYDYHIRMKGMPSQIIKKYNENVMQTYLDLFNGKEIELDMVSCCPLQLTKDYKAINRIEFKRKLKF